MANVRYLKVDEYALWDRFVDQSEQGSIFSKSWWLTATTNNNFEICVCEGDGEIFAGMPLPFFNTGNIRMPKLTQSVGILFKDKIDTKLQKKLTNQKEHTNLIIEHIKDGIKNLDLSFHYNYNYWSPLFWLGFKQTTKYTYLIDYEDFQADTHFVSFSKGHKWVLNKAARNADLVIEELSDLEMFYREAEKTYQRKGLKISYSFAQLKAIDDVLSQNEARKIFKISDKDGNIHAVNYYLYDQNEVYYWLGASDEQHRGSGAHTYLIWHSIKYFSDKSKRFNFGGSMMEEVDKNFRNFGSRPAPYYQIYKYGMKQMLLNGIKNNLPKNAKTTIKKILFSVIPGR
jgi:hypothetical protein